MKTFKPSRFWTLATVSLLSAMLPLHAGNRYDERKVDPKYEARGDDDAEPASDDAAAEPESATKNEESMSASEPAVSADAEAAAEAAPEQTEAPESLPPLPDPALVSVALGSGLDTGTFELTGGGTEFDVATSDVFARVTIQGADDWGLSGRIVVEQAEGEVAGDEMVRAACAEYIGGEQRVANLRFTIPESGLPVGRYRLEVLESREEARKIAAAVFTTKPVALPAGDRLRIGLHATELPPEELGCDGQTSRPDRLFATLETSDPTTLRVIAQIVAEEVEGLPRGWLVATQWGLPFNELTPGVSRTTTELSLPRYGLPVGRYRVEFREFLPPGRVVKSTVFTTRETEEAGFDLADPENGGLLESVTGEDGAGLTWAWMTLRPGNAKEWSSEDSKAGQGQPNDLVLSFFRRQPAMVGAVEVVPGDTASAGRIEVWGSMVSATGGFQKVAEKTFTASGGEPLVVPVPGSLMRFVKIRLAPAPGGEPLVGLRVVRVLEGRGDGYQPLRQRLPEVREWRLQPRHAAQQGLFFLQASGVEFQRQNNCMGCHVQSQALMGLSVARKNEYIVSDAVERELAGFTRSCATPAGDIRRQPLTDDPADPDRTNTIFGALGLAHATPGAATTPALQAAARWLAAGQEPEGLLLPDSSHPPVTQGEILQTAHAMEVWAAASAAGGDAGLRAPLARALTWMAEAPALTTQDKVFKTLALVRHGGAAEKKLARQLCQQLLGEQGAEGAWRVDPEEPGGIASPFATGQVLYALRQAGYSPNTPSFRRGVQWLLLTQREDASWRAGDTTSSFASTMWPVIALTGSFSSKADPARLSVTALPRPVPPPPPPPAPVVVAAKAALPKNILLVFDCSFSMTDKLRKRAKFDIAKEVLREVIGKLPDDTKVGLRLYGHRHGSMTGESRTDTELVVPVGPLNRAKLIGVIAAAKAQGQTPLVLSTQKAAEDLKKVGGGILVVVTDGEESCGGRPRKAGPELAALGVPLRLEVIGFALTGRRVVDEMNAFTAPTGGRFHTAADGLQLAAALKEATAPAPVVVPPPPPPPPAPEPEDLPYEVFDAQGLSVAKGSTLGEAPELAPGEYSVELRDGAKTAKLTKLKLAEGQTLELRYDPASGVLDRVL